jgi:hypothetical protein
MGKELRINFQTCNTLRSVLSFLSQRSRRCNTNNNNFMHVLGTWPSQVANNPVTRIGIPRRQPAGPPWRARPPAIGRRLGRRRVWSGAGRLDLAKRAEQSFRRCLSSPVQRPMAVARGRFRVCYLNVKERRPRRESRIRSPLCC